MWQVQMEKTQENDRYGFSHSNGLEKFQKERAKGVTNKGGNEAMSSSPQLQPDTTQGPQTLVVKRILDSGLMEQWNQMHPDAVVLPGDRIMEVNGAKSIPEMQTALHAGKVTMTVARYPNIFDIDLQKNAGARKLGFKFEKPRADKELLKITEVSAVGLLEGFNQQNLAAGRCHFVVTAGMHIEVANGVSGDSSKIAEELRQCEAVRLRIHRYDNVEKRRKLLQKLSAIQNFTPQKKAEGNMMQTPNSLAASSIAASTPNSTAA